jgi:hypothetical protein
MHSKTDRVTCGNKRQVMIAHARKATCVPLPGGRQTWSWWPPWSSGCFGSLESLLPGEWWPFLQRSLSRLRTWCVEMQQAPTCGCVLVARTLYTHAWHVNRFLHRYQKMQEILDEISSCESQSQKGVGRSDPAWSLGTEATLAIDVKACLGRIRCLIIVMPRQLIHALVTGRPRASTHMVHVCASHPKCLLEHRVQYSVSHVSQNLHSRRGRTPLAASIERCLSCTLPHFVSLLPLMFSSLHTKHTQAGHEHAIFKRLVTRLPAEGVPCRHLILAPPQPASSHVWR